MHSTLSQNILSILRAKRGHAPFPLKFQRLIGTSNVQNLHIAGFIQLFFSTKRGQTPFLAFLAPLKGESKGISPLST
jgi:hypothetical protein